MDFSSIWRQCLLLICILGTFCNCQSLLVSIFVLRASATKTQLIWVLYAPFVYPYSVSIKRNVQPVGQFLVRRKHRIPQHHSKGNKLQEMLKPEHFPALPLVSSSCCIHEVTPHSSFLMLQTKVNNISSISNSKYALEALW